MSLDISAGGLALYLNRRFEVGEVCEVTLPNIGTAQEGQGGDVVAVVCWNREAPKVLFSILFTPKIILLTSNSIRPQHQIK